MADDTRQSESKPTEEVTELEVRRPRRPKPKHDFPKTQAGKLWDAFGNPDEPINEMPGGMVNTAGGRPKEVTWRDAFRNPFKKPDGRVFYQVPCARDALIVGIMAGGGVGGVRFILKGEHDHCDCFVALSLTRLMQAWRRCWPMQIGQLVASWWPVRANIHGVRCDVERKQKE